ncbi:MAG: alpha/beta hydrolase [Verrucomicrobiae bacterium]
MPPALLRTLGSLAFALPLLAMAATGANPPTPDLPDFKPEEFRTLTCEDVVKNFRLASDIPYYGDKEAQADPYIAERCKLDIYYPTHQKNVPVLIYFHGGGMSGGSKDSKMELYKHLGCVVVTPNYRLSPRAKCPSYIEDAAAAAAWVKKNIAAYNGDPGRIFVSGHSAGAYLATCLATMPKFLEKQGCRPGDFAAYISISGEMVTHRAICAERGMPKGQIVIDEYSPINHVSKDVPPLVLLTGGTGLDIDSRPADNKLMCDAMRVAGNTRCQHFEVPGTDHGSIMDAAYAYLLQLIRANVKN